MRSTTHTEAQMGFSVRLYNGTESSDDGFYITAFHTMGNKNYLILALSIIYIITLMGNFDLLAVFIMNPSLQNPKYVAVCNLAVVDISLNSVVIPQMVPVFVFNLNYVSFGTCLSQMFFMHLFGDMESFSLALLADDRVIAICFPLRYLTINTNLRMLLILVGIWTLAFLLEVYPVALASRLSYCASGVVQSCCCEHGPETSDSENSGCSSSSSPVVAVMKIASTTQRGKAFHTCLTHLLLVLNMIIYCNLRVVQSSDLLTVSVTLPPMLNPIIHSLKTEELREKKICKDKSYSSQMRRVVDLMFSDL
ncbi:unnamed protein product [Coregonus sp. 'balchen']|nr:unnamed protein product [Coregonus sp. 'balchen']